MTLELMELTPNRQFIDPQFSSYKLSLDPIPTLEKKLDIAVRRIVPDSSQYSFLHAKLFALHNHLVGETINSTEFIYFVDESWCIRKAFVDDSSQLIQVLEMIKIPQTYERAPVCYNDSLKLVNDNLALFSDGVGRMYVLETGNRLLHYPWKQLSVVELTDANVNVVIQDARFLNATDVEEIHCLLYSVEQTPNKQKYVNVLYWIKIAKQDSIWKKAEMKKFISTVNASFDYVYLEPSCEALYIISSGSFTFIDQNDESTNTISCAGTHKTYCWSQTHDDINITIKVPHSHTIQVNTQLKRVNIMFNEQSVLNGELSHEIDETLTNWYVQGNLLEVQLYKKQEGLFWTDLILGDDSGDYIVHPTFAADAHRKLAHLCSEHEVLAPSGVTFNSQQIEECDFERDKYLTFERFSKSTKAATHRVNINTHAMVLIVQRHASLPPAVALRHDVDAYIWQPIFEDGNFILRHEGTLHAFGYVQASKQERKFSICAPNLSYCAILDTTRRILVYRQQKTIDNGELRNRATGKMVKHIAQQHVITLPYEEIVGSYAADSRLFILTVDHIYVSIL
ncbi:hypothetical protein AMK59_4079 [Oryctes borbonicus]|uniref:NudC domain-containing protein 1 n=1 Tax=Oryctes borbonicus TaxID=1629725 RepID=A0A0T6B8H9_9SCAR|nr:hypothetical protein AMK59_4079 [Oryctes borbonicus]